MKNKQFNTSDVAKVCRNKLSIQFGKGKELTGWYFLNGVKHARITVPKGKKFIPPKTYKSMARQLKLDTDQFDLLLECPLTHAKYVKILKGEN